MAELITCDTCSKVLPSPTAVRDHWRGNGEPGGDFSHIPRESESVDQTISRGFGEAGATR